MFGVTGGASGIGLALTKILLSRGCKVSVADISEDNLEAARASPGADILTTQVDVRNAAQVRDWMKQTVDKFGRLDGAANVAGTQGRRIGSYAGIKEQEEDDWDFIIATNLTGTMHCMREELKLLSEGGSIVNASSIAGVSGWASAAYAASKHGIIGLTRVAAKEEGKRGIRVNAVAP